MRFIGRLLVVDWTDRMNVGFLRLSKKNTFCADIQKSQLSDIYEYEGQPIIRPLGKTIEEPWGFDANRIISDNTFWLTDDSEEYLLLNKKPEKQE
ncbi:hypothetical protein [Kamptonema formosum]|uniref:hypothetical protein n=1 Tax=Kamptonema formosum TaxID=331992 RepID=UPI000346149E|nr:hypothetical protein [Kamptonema formosum]